MNDPVSLSIDHGDPAGSRGMMGWIKTASLILLAVFYIVAGVNHFRAPEFYLNIMPPYLPWHEAAVLWSGVAELLLGIGVLIPATRKLSCWGIIALLVLFLPVHIHMLANADLYPEAPVGFLWLRFPMQLVLGLWAWWHSK